MNLNTNISQELLESVERYLNKNMPYDEQKAFENKLKSDSDFRMQVEEIKTILLAIESQSLKENLDVYHESISEVTPEVSDTKIRFLQFRKIAAAAAIIIAIGSFWFFNQNSNAKLYANYFTPDPGLATTMSQNSNFEFYDAMVNYKQGNYKTAISKWKKLYTIKPKNDTLNYFIGVAQMADKNESEAITYLKKVTVSRNSSFKNDAYFYLGLAYLKNDNLELAKKNLTFSSIDNSKALLSELND